MQATDPFADGGKQNSPGIGKNDYGHPSMSGSCSGNFFLEVTAQDQLDQ